MFYAVVNDYVRVSRSGSRGPLCQLASSNILLLARNGLCPACWAIDTDAFNRRPFAVKQADQTRLHPLPNT